MCGDQPEKDAIIRLYRNVSESESFELKITSMALIFRMFSSSNRLINLSLIKCRFSHWEPACCSENEGRRKLQSEIVSLYQFNRSSSCLQIEGNTAGKGAAEAGIVPRIRIFHKCDDGEKEARNIAFRHEINSPTCRRDIAHSDSLLKMNYTFHSEESPEKHSISENWTLRWKHLDLLDLMQ